MSSATAGSRLAGTRRPAGTRLIALLIVSAMLPWGGVGRAQDIPTERPPDEMKADVMAGQNSDYFAGDKFTLNLIEEVERYHMTEANFWKNYSEGHLEDARGDLIFTLRWIPNHPRALYLMELLGEKMGSPESAIPYFEKALGLFPQHAYTRAQYGAYLLRVGARGPGIQELQTALAADSTLLQAKVLLDQARASQHDVPSAATSAPGGTDKGSGAKPPVAH